LTMKRILIADDHEVVRAGVRRTLAAEPSWQVCGEATDGRRTMSMAVVLKPDLVVLDIGMPGLNGIDVTRNLRRLLPNTEVLVLTMHDAEPLVAEALGAGARGFVLKSDPADILRAAVREVLAHRLYVSEALSFETRQTISGSITTGPLDRLTAREREVLQLLSEGCSNKEIGSALGISEKTAETHRTRLMAKLGIHSVARLVRYAVRNRIVEP
jgi:DNA-binding NarL/FixJ family response regulator